ncbi:MAG: PorP/SprF family type IX secretion system membrane protein [Bacteroidetes bacterium]|nr:PorP/SprF family type IX secretion system membrane protein [Bacteroidota bacterium]MCB9227734.1 PorP/SprF family type IX secretion system membrane protein [Chitinophagales bacterium]
MRKKFYIADFKTKNIIPNLIGNLNIVFPFKIYNKFQLNGILIICSICFFNATLAQDIHFSQYFANPISYNPANTGFYDGSYRLGLNHKQQWPWAIKGKMLNYNTTAVYGDFSFLDKKINNTDWAGIGINYINDIAGDGNLQANKVYLSLAYHKGLDKNHKHFLSLGFVAGLVHRSVDFSKLYFNSQWVDKVGFDLTLPQQETYAKQNTLYYDLGFGLQGSNKIGDKVRLMYGYSMLHFNRPKESFYQQDNKIGARHLLQAGVNYQVNDRIDIDASAYFTYQKKAMEILFSAIGGFKLNNNPKQKTQKLYVGAMYRLNDAVSPLMGYQFNRTRLLINYDINLSSLTKASKGNGGFEISLVQIGTFKRKKNYKYKTHCPSF